MAGAPSPAREARVLPRSLFLKFIAYGGSLLFSFRYDTNFFFFVVNKRMWRNAFCQENVGADGGLRTNHGVAAHNGGSCINADAILDRRVAFFSAQRLYRAERPGDEGNTLVKFHVRTDFGRLADNYSSAVINEKMGPDLRAGMNIDSGAAMRPLGHDARNQRHPSVKQMCHSINGDRFKRGIREDDFLVSRSSRIAFVSRIDVRPK